MTLERLKNLRVIDGRGCWLEVQRDRYPQGSPKWQEISAQLEADRKERDAVHLWIESIPRDRTANIIILRYVKNLRWDEIARLIGGISASGVKMDVMRYIRAAEKQEEEIRQAAFLDLLAGHGVKKENDAGQRERKVNQPV